MKYRPTEENSHVYRLSAFTQVRKLSLALQKGKLTKELFKTLVEAVTQKIKQKFHLSDESAEELNQTIYKHFNKR